MKPTPEQQAVIDAQTGTVLVLAAVGSGKTTTLTRRVAAALQPPSEIRPERVLALTFTNRAAHHMVEGLVQEVGEVVAAKVVVSTFHALCVRILRSDPPGAGLPADFRVIDEDDAIEILNEIGVENPERAVHALHSATSAVPLGHCAVAEWHTGAVLNVPWGAAYTDALKVRGAIDFAGLVYLSRAVLTEIPETAGRWSTAFDLVLVDEVQDTHLSEYEVLRVLAAQASSLCLVGDLDQTIYSWRGSAPRALLARLSEDYGPVLRLKMTENFRSTRHILRVADAVAAAMPDRESEVRPASDLHDGEVATLTVYSSTDAEAEAIAQDVQRRIQAGIAPSRMAVLVRTNKAITTLSAAMQRYQVPHTTLETTRFFRRSEVKDALALARLVHDPHDAVAARRIARRMVRGVGPKTVARIQAEGRPVGLSITDVLDARTVRRGDPFWMLERPDCVVLDTETTGFDPEEDEIIEVAAVRVRAGSYSQRPGDTFSMLLRNTVPVGASEAVHHISDALLREKGREPKQALLALQAFVGDLPVVGHNVQFDVKMLHGYARRLGVDLRLTVKFDTLPFARRLVPEARNHRLGTLVDTLGISVIPTHRALDDVLATVELARVLGERATPGHGVRWALLAKEAPAFAKLRAALERWQRTPLRPAELIRQIAAEALRYSDPDAARRQQNLAVLADRVAVMDDADLPPAEALAKVIDTATLVREVDALDGLDGVRILTMHQSKGLEFDEVWLPGLSESGLPSWQAIQKLEQQGDSSVLEEERRLLYVAVTRARRRLYLSWATRNERGFQQKASRFLGEIRGTFRDIAGT